jgi:hypothetical protein
VNAPRKQDVLSLIIKIIALGMYPGLNHSGTALGILLKFHEKSWLCLKVTVVTGTIQSYKPGVVVHICNPSI